jgi:predicted nucleic acid-binding protein
MVAAANSTPLIALSKIGLFELLKEYFDEVIIPAENLKVPVTGTVGLLMLASEEGRIDLKKAMDGLIASGFRLSKSEYKKIIGGV